MRNAFLLLIFFTKGISIRMIVGQILTILLMLMIFCIVRIGCMIGKVFFL